MNETHRTSYSYIKYILDYPKQHAFLEMGSPTTRPGHVFVNETWHTLSLTPQRISVCNVFQFATYFSLQRISLCNVFQFATYFSLQRISVCNVF
jgi:hypothetical protein